MEAGTSGNTVTSEMPPTGIVLRIPLGNDQLVLANYQRFAESNSVLVLSANCQLIDYFGRA